jgi:hypothetical protein
LKVTLLFKSSWAKNLDSGFAVLRRLDGAGGVASRSGKAGLGQHGFAFDLLKQITREQPGTNVFISPFSVSTVLQMVANGAAGDTKAEMQRVLKTAGLPPETLNAACKDLNQSLNSQTNVILNLANAIWYKEGIHLKPGFVSVNKNFSWRNWQEWTSENLNRRRPSTIGRRPAHTGKSNRLSNGRSIRLDTGDSGQRHLFQGQVGPAV